MEVYDVEGSEHSVINLRLSNPSLDTDTFYSKFRTLYVLFKSDDKLQTSLTEKGIFVSYTAIGTGKLKLPSK